MADIGVRAADRGFTLIEVLIVIALFAAGAVALLQIFSMAVYGGSENENTFIATALAQEKMEEIRGEPYSSVAAEARAGVTDYAFFEREVLVSTAVSGLKQVTVNVYWVERSGDVLLSLVTYVPDI